MKFNSNSLLTAFFYSTAALCSALGSSINTAYCADPVASASVKQPFKIKPLSGSLDMAPLFNSNSPEIVLNPGILLSTMSPTDSRDVKSNKDFTDAHLNYKFKGDFGVFLHHISKQDEPLQTDQRVLKLSLIAHNPGHKAIKLKTLARATFLSQPDAPFVALPPLVSVMDAINITPDSPVVGPVSPYAGPGDRVTWEFLSEKARQENAPELTIEPGQYQLIEEIPVPVKHLRPALNGRSYLAHFHSSGAVELALLSHFDPGGTAVSDPSSASVRGSVSPDPSPSVSPIPSPSPSPSPIDYGQLLKQSDIVHPRESDKNYPSHPGRKGPLIYGRVAGVSKGLTFNARISEKVVAHKALNLAYPVSSLERGTFGTGKIQAAPMIRRYRGSAYRAQGNYGIGYKIKIRLSNSDKVVRLIKISLACPVKEDNKRQNTLTFLKPPASNVFFRGTVMIRERPIGAREFFHLVMHKGEKMPVLKVVSLEPYQSKDLEFEMYYPPDATPPQMLLLQSELP
ncbi:MAG: DUF3370 family protein [Candidatus Obscuribacter sp.]|nr:DUF3370 family protein [Candidatus Obscuribacter sp.]